MKRAVLAIAACIFVVAGVVAAESGSDAKKKPGVATFAGGCFWCMEPPFDKIPGVISTTSGYTGGTKKFPTYKEVSHGETGHAETLEVLYDTSKVTYSQLLDVYWHNVDPTTPDRQFCDAGTQYRPEIFYHDDAQKALAEASKRKLEESGRFKKIVVRISPASTFYPAEEYHQDFYKKEPDHYHSYRAGCGRDRRLKELWGDMDGH